MDAIWSFIILGSLAAARVLPVAFMVPAFGGQSVPAQVRMGLAMGLALLAVPNLAGVVVALDPIMVVLMLLREILVGFTLGLLASLVFRAAEMAGILIDNFRGANAAEILAPQTGERSSPTGLLFLLLATLVFFEIGGLAHLAVAIGRSYEVVPIGLASGPGVDNAGRLLQLVIVSFARLFESAIGMAAPVLVAAFIADLVLGLIARSVSQVPVYFVGLPAKGLAGLGVVLLSLGALRVTLEGAFLQMPALLLHSLRFW